VFACVTASAQTLRIDVQGVAQPTPVAIVPFGWEGDTPDMPLDVVKVINDDLLRSGRFAPVDESKMLQKPTDGADVDFQDWSFVGVEAVVVGKVIQTGANAYTLQFQLFDVFGRRQLVGYRMPASRGTMRSAAHRAADMIYEKLTGIKGVFGTKVAYVTANREGDGRLYSLIVSDQDGFNEHTIMESADPIMSPAWSPDSRQLVVTLGGVDGNLDIYVLDINSRNTTRLTTHRAIDTEGTWSPDGRYIYFTSDRSGGPQIYRVGANGGTPERVTFEGSYNARPRLSPDGKRLAMVHNDRGNYRIAVMSIDRKDLLVLSTGRQDESPSFAPNSDILIYATRQGRNGVLETVSADGLIRQKMASRAGGDVREPVWSPFPRF
jgi:TolB protein